MSEEVKLRELLEQQIVELEKRMILAYQAHTREHVLEHEAIEKAHIANTAKLDAMNEFRSQLNLERRDYVTHGMFEVRFDAAATRMHVFVDNIDKRIVPLERSQAAAQGSVWALGVVLTVLTVVLNVLLRFWK